MLVVWPSTRRDGDGFHERGFANWLDEGANRLRPLRRGPRPVRDGHLGRHRRRLDLPVEPEPEEVYDLRSPSEDAVELALELADYCDLEGVTGVLTRRRSGDMPFDAWKTAIDELETCIRWHD